MPLSIHLVAVGAIVAGRGEHGSSKANDAKAIQATPARVGVVGGLRMAMTDEPGSGAQREAERGQGQAGRADPEGNRDARDQPDELDAEGPALALEEASERSQRRLPVTEGVASRLLTLPLYGHMTDDQVDLVADTLLRAL